MKLVLFTSPLSHRARAHHLVFLALARTLAALVEVLDRGDACTKPAPLTRARLADLAKYVDAREDLDAWLPRLEAAAVHWQDAHGGRTVVVRAGEGVLAPWVPDELDELAALQGEEVAPSLERADRIVVEFPDKLVDAMRRDLARSSTRRAA